MEKKTYVLILYTVSLLFTKELDENRIIACLRRDYHKKGISQLMLTTLQPEIFLLTYILYLRHFSFIEFTDKGVDLGKLTEYFKDKQHIKELILNTKTFEEMKSHGVCLYSIRFRESLVFKVPLVNYSIRVSNIRCVNHLDNFFERKDVEKYHRKERDYMDDIIIEPVNSGRGYIECVLVKGWDNIRFAEDMLRKK